jgi:hypothetical protein
MAFWHQVLLTVTVRTVTTAQQAVKAVAIAQQANRSSS